MEGVVVVVRIGKEEIERSQLVFELSCLVHFHIPAWISRVPAWGCWPELDVKFYFIFISTFFIPSPFFRSQRIHKDYYKYGDLRLTRFKLSTMAGPSNAPKSLNPLSDSAGFIDSE